LFPPLFSQLVLIGEESGKLPDMVGRIAKYYETRVEIFVARLSVLIEPIVLVLVGGIVGVIVVAMFLPIFQISSIVK
jgi:type II secretory pathway component PulF